MLQKCTCWFLMFNYMLVSCLVSLVINPTFVSGPPTWDTPGYLAMASNGPASFRCYHGGDQVSELLLLLSQEGMDLNVARAPSWAPTTHRSRKRDPPWPSSRRLRWWWRKLLLRSIRIIVLCLFCCELFCVNCISILLDCMSVFSLLSCLFVYVGILFGWKCNHCWCLRGVSVVQRK